MWESKEQTLDINYSVDELWFPGVYGQPVPKPIDIKKWEEGKCYLLLGKTIPRLKADRMLMDLSQIALKYAQHAVQQRLVLKPTSKGENRAPVVFQYDSGGDYLQYGLLLQQLAPANSPTSKPSMMKAPARPRLDRLVPPHRPRPLHQKEPQNTNYKRLCSTLGSLTPTTPSKLNTGPSWNYTRHLPRRRRFTSANSRSATTNPDATLPSGS